MPISADASAKRVLEDGGARSCGCMRAPIATGLGMQYIGLAANLMLGYQLDLNFAFMLYIKFLRAVVQLNCVSQPVDACKPR